MKRILQLVTGLMFLCLSLSAQEFMINEVMTANTSLILDKTYYNYSEWIEIYNPSEETKNLSGYYLSDIPENTKLWQIPSVSVPAKGFKVIWFDKMNSGLHTSFRIRSNRELIMLSNSSGTIVDSIRVEFPFQNCSYGRNPDGALTWQYYTQPTQGTSNTTTPVHTQAPDPEFSLKEGRYSGSQSLVLSLPITGYTIRYTTDGSEPTETSTLYENSISISKTTTIKARAFAAGKVPSNTVVNTYFINEHTFTIPVVSLSTDPKYLWDNTIGIYTDGTNGISGNCSDQPKNWNQDWERNGYIEYFHPDGSRFAYAGAGIKMFGGCSRGNPQKSFSVNFRDKYGADNVRYPFFQSKQVDRFNALVLRNSGNDWNRTMFHDAMMQSLLIGQMDVDYNAYTPSAVYLNGEYWGILNTREKLNEGYLFSNYGLDEDSIDFLEGNQVIIAGSRTDYSTLINFMTANDLSVPANYQYVKDRIDVNEYINYMIAEIYSSNTDWPGNNLKYWKPKKAGGKWRWILYDLDFGFGLYGHSPDHNTLTFALEPNYPEWPNPSWSTLFFRRIILSEEFREQFIDKFNIYIYSIYNPARVNRIIDSLKQIIATEMPYHFARWGGSVNDWENSVNTARTWAAQRPDFMMTHLQNYFALDRPYTIKVRSDKPHAPFVLLNEITIHDTLFEGSCFGNREINIKAISDKNYRFKQWTLRHSNSENVSLIANNSQWKYLDDNTQPDASWKTLSFNDNAWSAGNGQLGYGDGDEATTLSYGSDANNKYITYYFRKIFTVSDPTGISSLLVNLLVDDGAVVYLNGDEILRYNMPSGTITSSTFATTYEENNEYYSFVINNIQLLPGSNMLAVEVHQNSVTSSDVSFDINASGIRILDFMEETISNPEITMTLNSDLELIAGFEKMNVINNLYINEICTKNTLFPDEQYEFDDWIELYNSGNDTINLAGLYLTNNLAYPTLFEISGNIPSQTQMLPHSYKILWADGESEQGLLHLDFKLNKDGGEIGLAHSADQGIYYIDSLVYPDQKTDYSYGRYTDGMERWFMLSRMTPGESNIYTELPDVDVLNLVQIYPNPADYMLTFIFGQPIEKNVWVTIYSILGQEILRKPLNHGSTKETIDISTLNSGMYIVTLSNESSVHTEKLIKK
ncbi:MAG: CotH kinase family protein [Bacteroidales bacterium]|nr:CotH kinase family protein [Bacteroidales bacterium]